MQLNYLVRTTNPITGRVEEFRSNDMKEAIIWMESQRMKAESMGRHPSFQGAIGRGEVPQEPVIPPKDHPRPSEVVLEHGGTVLLWSMHTTEECDGQACTIHNRTPHSMRAFPQHWRNDRGIMERVCEHGVGHPDPDNPWPPNDYRWLHGCDGCCSESFAQNGAL